MAEVAMRSAAHSTPGEPRRQLPAKPVRIPYVGTTLPGYFWRSPVAGQSAPLLILHQGRDAWPEKTMYMDMLFTAEDTGLVHCQFGATAVAEQRMFDRLEENLRDGSSLALRRRDKKEERGREA
jgi:hypothetical protein